MIFYHDDASESEFGFEYWIDGIALHDEATAHPEPEPEEVEQDLAVVEEEDEETDEEGFAALI